MPGGYVRAFTCAQYANLPARFTAFKNTLVLAPPGTVAALVAADPLVYFLAVRANPKVRAILPFLIIMPFWTSILICAYAWIFILGGRGIPQLLNFAGPETTLPVYVFSSIRRGVIPAVLPLS